MKKKVYLGVDVGSISINLLVIDSNDTVLFDSYIRGQGNPIAAVQKGLKELEQNIPDDVEISGVCVTGSGRSLIGAVVGADIIKNEIIKKKAGKKAVAAG